MEDNATNTTQLLYDAALQGDFTLLQDLLLKDPLLLHRSSPSSNAFPLHVACKLGHVQFTWELLRLNPNLTEELDPNDKSCALHLAARNGHLELVRSLISVNPTMCFARDLHGRTPVHVAAMKGHLHVLDELMRTVPGAARERTGPVVGGGGGDTIMHLCVKYNQLEALRLLASRVADEEMLNATDGDGNTVLHVAVANKQLEIVRFLVSDRRLMTNTPNLHGLTAMDIFKQSHKDLNNDDQLRLTLKRAKVLLSEDIRKEKEKDKHIDWFENQRSALMVVASLIATMAFQAGLNPPGGAWQDNQKSVPDTPGHTAGLAIMPQQKKKDYISFLILITVGLMSSMSSILLLISGLPCRRFFVVLIMLTMWVAITAMTLAYGISLLALAPNDCQYVVWYIIRYCTPVWALIMGLLLLGHVIVWTVRFLKQSGRLIKKLFGCCFRKRRIG